MAIEEQKQTNMYKNSPTALCNGGACAKYGQIT